MGIQACGVIQDCAYSFPTVKARPYGESQHSTALLELCVSSQPSHIKNENALNCTVNFDPLIQICKWTILHAQM